MSRIVTIRIPSLPILDKYVSCRGKVRYGHQETAERAVAEMLKKDVLVEAYKCRHCPGWHVGKRSA